MSDENQKIDPALLGDNPSGLDPSQAVNGPMNLKQKPHGIVKINKKGLYILGGVLGTAAIVATTTFNGTGSAVNSAAKDAVSGQSRARPTEMQRSALWYANVPDKVAATEPEDALLASGAPGAGPRQGAGGVAPAAGAASGVPGLAGSPTVPDLTGKAVNPIVAATAARVGAAPYQGGAAAAALPPEEAAAQQAKATAVQQEQQRIEQGRMLQQQQLDTARKAGLTASGFGDKQSQAPAAAAQGLSNGLMGQAPTGLGQNAGQGQRDDDQNKQERKDQFLKSQAQAVDSDYSSSRKTAALSPYELKAGGLIPAVMISGVNSDLPGEAIAQVRENVYDSKTGRHLLIPQGARLVGLYDAHVAYGQQRVLMAWNRVIFPDGSSFNLKGMPGADMSGYAGFTDQVDNHYTKIFGSSVLLSLISAGVQLSQPNTGGSNNNNQPGVSQTLGAALGQQIGQTAMNVTQKNLSIQPTLEIRPGYRFNIMVTADMILSPVQP